MNKLHLPHKAFVGLGLIGFVPVLGSAQTYILHRDNIIPAKFEQALTVEQNRPGDTFLVKVRETDQLPANTEIEGRIDRIHPARGNRPASMDLRFTRVLLPNHSSVEIDALPLALDNKYITRTGDGRLVAKQDLRKQQNDVVGGAIGGFIIGSIFHRRITGTVLGTFIGAGVAEADRAKDANTIVSNGEKIGVLINEDVTIDLQAPSSPSDHRMTERLDRRMADPFLNRTSQGESRYSPRANIALSFKNKPLQFPEDARPYRIGRDIMVPLEPTAKQLSLDIDRRRDRTVYVDGPDINLKLIINSRQARLDGRPFALSHTVMEMNGVLYVPLDSLIPLLKDDLLLNGEKVIIDPQTGN